MPEITITNSQGAVLRSNSIYPQSWDTGHDLSAAGNIDTSNNTGSSFTLGVAYSGYGGGTYSIYRC